MRKIGSIPEKEAKVIIYQILEGLVYLNQGGIKHHRVIHYDLKPQNIIFHKSSVKIADFGCCKLMGEDDSRVELTNQAVGTKCYQPPECFSKISKPMINSKVDIWSVGVIFYEMLYGVRPFGDNANDGADPLETMESEICNLSFPTKPSTSTECKEFIRRCLVTSEEGRATVSQALESQYFKKL
mmetsp:Transcript_26546/g.30471  ORF Transcript_26546/g.30471 Transcript_26546/m.30471 type:complete len:184 (-) Transcript_26546:20-571(-)